MPRVTGYVARAVAVTAGSVLASVVLATTLATAAQAHAVLEATNPQAGAQLAQLPGAVTLSFGEDVSIDDRSLQVLSPSGARVDSRTVRHPNGIQSEVATAIAPTLPHASYTVVWRVISADSHPVAGTFSFGYGVPAGATVPAPHGSTTVGFLNGFARFTSYVGIVLAAGALIFAGLIWPGAWQRRRIRVLLVTGLALLALSSASLLLLAGPYDAAEGLGKLFSGPLLHQTLTTKYGKLVALRLGVAALGIVLLSISRGAGSRLVRPDVAATGVVALLTFSLSEHAGTGHQAPLAASADALHLASVTAWIGGLVALLLLLLDRGEPLPAGALRRWSKLAFSSVILIVATGAYASWREVGTFPAFPDTPYGRLVLIKVGLLGFLVMLGGYGRKLSRRDDPESMSVTALRRAIGTEVILSVGVLAVAAILVDVQPGRDSYDPAHTMNVVAYATGAATLDARVHVDTTRPGRTSYAVNVRTPAGKPQPYQQISGLLTESAKGLGPVRFILPASATGTGTATAVVVPESGRWQLDLQIRTDAVTSYAVATSYLVR